MLNGSGGYIKINGGDIEIGTSGAASFKASMKELAGGGSASASGPSLAKPSNIKIESGHHLQYQALDSEGKPLANRPYVMFMPDGSSQTGKTDASGKTKRITTTQRQQVQIYIEDAEHQGFRVL
jgi:type VI secretion system secreted protein VgrG